MDEDGHHAVQVDDLILLALIAKVLGDQVGAFLDNGKLQLRHAEVYHDRNRSPIHDSVSVFSIA